MATSCRYPARSVAAPPARSSTRSARGLACERIIDSTRRADHALCTVWRDLEDGCGGLLLVTAAGLEALGIEGGDAAEGPTGAEAGTASGAANGAAAGEVRPGNPPKGP